MEGFPPFGACWSLWNLRDAFSLVVFVRQNNMSALFARARLNTDNFSRAPGRAACLPLFSVLSPSSTPTLTSPTFSPEKNAGYTKGTRIKKEELEFGLQ